MHKYMLKGIFLSDLHMPEHINLSPVYSFIRDFRPDVTILGGDIIDATGLHGAEHMRADQFDMDWYERDVELLRELVTKLRGINRKTRFVYLVGNHEQRYDRLVRNFPKIFRGAFNFRRDVFDKLRIPVKWIPYKTKDSYYRIGDCLFMHGVKFPDAHAKLYAIRNTPYKVVYGHLHHYQVYTTHRPLMSMSPRYAINGGCLSTTNPEWKEGEPNQWINGFVSFVNYEGVTVPTVHMIEKGRFYIGGKCYV